MSNYEDSAPWPRPIVGWYAVAILLLAFLLSVMDRVVFGLLVEPIKADLGLSDAAIGILLGFAFAVVFTVMGLLCGWLTDRVSRRVVIVSIAVFTWSLSTAACGLAGSFTQMLVARIGVATGESAVSPAAYSIISDYFPREKLGRAMGVYVSGAFYGAGIAFMVGGAVMGVLDALGPIEVPIVGVVKPWQLTFFIVGLPGVLVSLLVLTAREPVRRNVSHVYTSKTAAFRYMFDHWRFYTAHFIGFGMLVVIIMVVMSWGPVYFIRVHGFSQAEVGMKLGLIMLILSPGGIYTGSWLADIWQKSGHPDAPLRVGVLSGLATLPFIVSAHLVTDPNMAIALYCPLVFFASLGFGCGPTSIQLTTPNQLRAQVSAVYLVSLNIVSSIFGPTGVGLATDYLFKDELAVGYSMALMCSICAPLAALLLWLGCRPYCAALRTTNETELKRYAVSSASA